MAIRPFGFITVTGTAPQPAFGTTVATTFNVTPDMYTGNTQPGSNPSIATVVVASGTGYMFLKGDRIHIGPQGGPYDEGKVTAVSTDTLIVQGLTKGHASGEFVVICVQASEIRIQANADTLYIGNDTLTASTTSKGCIAFVLLGGLYDVGKSSAGSLKGTGAYWVWGTASDTYLASIDTI